jgi:hypothetical protein
MVSSLECLHVHIVTNLIKSLPGNSSVNSPTYTGGQHYNRSVFYVKEPPLPIGGSKAGLEAEAKGNKKL